MNQNHAAITHTMSFNVYVLHTYGVTLLKNPHHRVIAEIPDSMIITPKQIGFFVMDQNVVFPVDLPNILSNKYICLREVVEILHSAESKLHLRK